MGIDAVILFKAKKKDPYLGELPLECSVEDVCPPWNDFEPSATHMAEVCSRYFGPEYPRGFWPDLCRILLILMADKDVTDVWYGGDCNVGVKKVTLLLLNELNKAYIEHGCG